MGPDDTDGFWTRTTSPDGAHVWIVDAHEAKMSHWIIAGTLRRASPEAELFAPPHDWSFEARTWTSNDVLRLVGRRYPGGLPGVVVTLDVRAERGTIETQDLDELRARGAYGWLKPGVVPAPPSGPQPFDVLLRWLEAYPKE